MKNIIVIVFVLIISACNSTMKVAYGIKDPALENSEGIKKYLDNNNIESSNVVVYKDLNSFALASKSKMLTIPDAMFFNSSGNYVNYKKSAQDCNAKVEEFIGDITSLNEQEDDAARNIAQIKNLLVDLKGNPLPEKEKFDVYVFINWAKFVGKLNRDKAFDWINLLEEAQNKGVSVKYYLVNCDYQESWNLTEQEKESLGL